MAKKIKLGIIYGGRSGEHAVSLMSARSVLSVIDRTKYDVIEIGITRRGQWVVGENVWEGLQSENYEALRPAIFIPSPQNPGIFTLENGQLSLFSNLDVIFPVMHGTFSEDGTLQGLLELADIAYVGSGVLGSSVCMDKGLFKHVMVANHIPTLPFVVINRSEIEADLDRCVEKAEGVENFPLFTKPANLGSSVGVNKCTNRSELIEGMHEAARYDRRIVVEKGLENAQEIEVSVLGNENPAASIPGEVIPKDIFYTYHEKYINETAELIIPAPMPPDIVSKVQNLAIKAYQITDCAGMARVDFLVDRQNGDLFLNEINTIPGFTKISMYPKLWEATDLSYRALIETLIQLAMERKAQRDQTEREFRI
jgi:D-alanine-D-alanine ligase